MSTPPSTLPQGVEAGGLGQRLLAYVIDNAAGLVASLVAGILGGMVWAGTSVSSTVVLVVSVVLGVACLAWALFCWWGYATHGASVGARLAGVRLVGIEDGRPIGWGRVFVRWLIFAVLAGTSIGWILLIVFMITNPKRQSWHDQATKAVVIKAAKPSADAGQQAGYGTPQVASGGATTVGLPPRLAQATSGFEGQTAPGSYGQGPESTPAQPIAQVPGFGDSPTDPSGQPWTAPGSQPSAPPASQPSAPPAPGSYPSAPPASQPAAPQAGSQPSAPPPPAPQAGQGWAPPASQPSAPQPVPAQPGQYAWAPPGPAPQGPASTGFQQSPAQPGSAAPPAQAPAQQSSPSAPPPPAAFQPPASQPPAPQPPAPDPTQPAPVYPWAAPPAPPAPPAAAAPQPGAASSAPAPDDDEGSTTHLAPARGQQRQPEEGWLIVLDDGRQVPVAGPILIGRNPEAQPGEQAQLIAIGDSSRRVSKTHLALNVDARGLFVVDRGSTNGTAIETGLNSYAPCNPGQPVRLSAGQVVSFGDRTFEVRREA